MGIILDLASKYFNTSSSLLKNKIKNNHKQFINIKVFHIRALKIPYFKLFHTYTLIFKLHFIPTIISTYSANQGVQKAM